LPSCVLPVVALTLTARLAKASCRGAWRNERSHAAA
jgi:hypothetical protein